MKRGRDDEKMMKPMFPRLHVHDTDKGGPRAPPRNKMALYEQLSIPSQRFNHQSVLPLDASNNSSLIPPGSSSQSGMERNLHHQHQVTSSTSFHLAENFNAQKPHGSEMTASLAWYNQRKKVGNEDDFMVPVFVNSGIAQSNGRANNEIDKEKVTPITVTSSSHSIKIQEVGVKDSKMNNCLSADIRQEVRDEDEESPKAHLSANLLADVSRNGFDQDDGETGVKVDSSRDIDDGIEARIRSESHSGDEVDNVREYCRGRTCVSLQQGNGDASDGGSETSMVDSISNSHISPDNVVGIIGQKHFWKARRAIANQQRVFAVQVFELHRLIKVQRLIAGSPHLLLEDSSYLCKSSSKISPTKKLLPAEYVVKSLPLIVECKDDSEKANNNHRMEYSAENAVGKATTFSSGKNNNQLQPLNYPPIAGNPPPVPAASSTRMGSSGSWCFPPQPSPGNRQWLIPVISPSEGLIYKPYPAPPGYMGSVCGGYFGHCIPTPMPGNNFVGPAYGISAPPYHQSNGFPAAGNGYFPPCGMPAMNPNFSDQPTEQINEFGHPHNLPGANITHQQSSCNFPAQKNGTVNTTKETEHQPGNKESSSQLQGSNGSIPGERVVHGNGNTPQNALHRFPGAPVVENDGTQVRDQDEQPPTSSVIRVVPHNPTLATESAARIFQSIQEERKRFDSV